MTNANVMRALEELHREYAEVGGQVERLQHDLTALESRHQRLGEAIQSLERLNDPTDSRSPGSDVWITGTDAAPSRPTLQDVMPAGPSVPADSPITKYIKRGGEGRRLSSTFMVRDVVEELDRVVTREELKEAFFQKFSREEMKRFWDRPDNAFGTAVARAVKDKLIEQGKEDGAEVFGSHAVAERLERMGQEAASSGTGAGENE